MTHVTGARIFHRPKSEAKSEARPKQTAGRAVTYVTLVSTSQGLPSYCDWVAREGV